MPAYKLVEHEGEAFKRIMHGKYWIGRVCRHKDGTYLAVIGKYINARGCPSEAIAYQEAVAQHLRYMDYVEKPKPQKKKLKPELRVVAQETFNARTAQMRPRLFSPTSSGSVSK